MTTAKQWIRPFCLHSMCVSVCELWSVNAPIFYVPRWKILTTEFFHFFVFKKMYQRPPSYTIISEQKMFWQVMVTVIITDPLKERIVTAGWSFLNNITQSKAVVSLVSWNAACFNLHTFGWPGCSSVNFHCRWQWLVFACLCILL